MPSSHDRSRRANTEPAFPTPRRTQVRKPSSLQGYRAEQAIGGRTQWSTISAKLSCGSEPSITGADIPSVPPVSFGLRRWLDESDPIQRLLDAHHCEGLPPNGTGGGHGSPEFHPSTPFRDATWSSAVKGSLPIQFGKGVHNSTCGGQDVNMVSIGSFSDDIDR